MFDMTKPFKNFGEQVDIILGREMQSRELNERELREEIKQRLRYINYYRLSAYWHPFIETRKGEKGKELFFQANVHWEGVMARYMFDRRLRNLLFDAISRIEIALRTQVVYQWVKGSHSFPRPQSDPQKYMKSFGGIPSEAQHKKEEERGKVKALIQSNYDNNFENYAGFDKSIKRGVNVDSLAAWTYVEFATMGNIHTLLRICLPDKIVKKIAKEMGILHASFFRSAIAFLKDVRNSCAHQSRIWDRTWLSKKKIPILRQDRGLISRTVALDKTAAALCICAIILGKIAPKSKWRDRCKELITGTGNSIPELYKHLGFTNPEWFNDKIWS